MTMPTVDQSETHSSDRSSTPQDDSFEQVIERLQAIVTRLEEGELPLEESLKVFEEGVRLSRLGERQLDDAERRIDLLLRDADAGPESGTDTTREPQTRPLDEKELDRS